MKNLPEEFVFVGGATVSLYADRITEEVRPTDDVDILVEIASHGEYAALQERLRHLGFENDTTAKFVGRYKINGVIVDLMPTNESILGFSNRWYSKGFTTSIEHVLDEFHGIKIFAPEYFIASKLEAFKSRGNNDGRTSSDFEDIIFVLDNRSTIWQDLNGAQSELYAYLKSEFSGYLQQDNFEEWIESHAGFGTISATSYLMDGIIEFVNS